MNTTLALVLLALEPSLPEDAAGRFARLALDCVGREYPNKIAHVLSEDGDARPPRELTPAFYGCYDWHSAVHGHWLLVRLLRIAPDASFADEARTALGKNLTEENIATEVEYLSHPGRGSFERPYGLAWLLQLSAELHEWKADDTDAAAWSRALAPLEEIAASRFRVWLPKLSHPIRTGEHSQTAFAFGLVLDWSRTRGDEELERLLVSRCKDFYLADRGWNFAFEPGGQDFLSPGLAEADLLRRILTEEEFAQWLTGFLPELSGKGSTSWLTPCTVTDKADGKLAHLDGLNLSRAWMLDGIAAGLPENDPRKNRLIAARDAHRDAGLAAVTGEHYAGGHWLGSFAVYLVTRRGVE